MAAGREKGPDREKRLLSGFLLVDKPKGITSRKVVDIVRSCAGFDGKIGHSGTLDPMATGLLVLCLGKATRLASYLIRDDKSYSAVMEMGRETDSGDAEGEVVFRGDDQLEVIADGDIHRAFDRYRGVFSQVPPRFSARKVGGRRAYELARSGMSVELKASRVEIKELEITRIEKPQIHFFLKCSSGTYVRSLALDVGRELGTGAHLTSLRRLEVGPFSIEEACELNALKEACRSREIGRWLFPPHKVLRKLQKVVVNADGERLLKQGSPVAQEYCASLDIGPSSGAEVQVWNSSSEFFAVGRIGREEAGFRTRLFSTFRLLGKGGNEASFLNLAALVDEQIKDGSDWTKLDKMFPEWVSRIQWKKGGIRPAQQAQNRFPLAKALIRFNFQFHPLWWYRPDQFEAAFSSNFHSLGGTGIQTELKGNVFYPYLAGLSLDRENLVYYRHWVARFNALKLPYSYGKYWRRFQSSLGPTVLHSFPLLQGLLELDRQYCSGHHCALCPLKGWNGHLE